jgi:hypothetical protein
LNRTERDRASASPEKGILLAARKGVTLPCNSWLIHWRWRVNEVILAVRMWLQGIKKSFLVWFYYDSHLYCGDRFSGSKSYSLLVGNNTL